MKDDTMVVARRMLDSLNENGELIVQGVRAFSTLRSLIPHLMREAGVRVEYDPHIEPTILDYLGIVGPVAAERALIGAMVGLLAGALVDRPVQGALVGTAVGGTIGLVEGVQAVDEGWRIRLRLSPQGILRLFPD